METPWTEGAEGRKAGCSVDLGNPEILETECFNWDGSVTKIKERVPVTSECGVFGAEQTNPYQPTVRTRASRFSAAASWSSPAASITSIGLTPQTRAG